MMHDHYVCGVMHRTWCYEHMLHHNAFPLLWGSVYARDEHHDCILSEDVDDEILTEIVSVHVRF